MRNLDTGKILPFRPRMWVDQSYWGVQGLGNY